MKWTNTIFSVLLFFTGLFVANAQVTCEFTLELSDSFGDGWNGASLDIELDGVTTNYTFDFSAPDPSFITFPVLVSGTQSINITYNSGFFDSEASYRLLDPVGQVIFEDGNPPLVGLAFSGEVSCPTCPPPPPSSVIISDIRAFSADVSWTGSVPDALYLLEYGSPGFTPGTGEIISTTETDYTLTNLEQDTEYELYLSVVCEGPDTTTLINSYLFETLIAIDLGISGLINPVSGCAMGMSEKMTIQLQNYGGAPQTFIPFNYSINGVISNINQPIDGVYTGVLGIDSTDIMDFDMNFDFSTPGEYEILVWTEMEGDTVFTNDTFAITIVNTPVIADLPVYETFETEEYSGWSLGMEGQNQSWQFGQPANTVISNAAGGENAWVTNLTGFYNNNEDSYLESPCFDFSGYTEDPIIDFAMFIESESNFDGMWLETTIDGGQTWTKLGLVGDDAVNWYNQVDNIYGDWWSGQGVFNGWVIASHALDGTAGSEDVRIRFAFGSDGSVQREGVAVDNIYIHEALTNDVSLFGGTNESLEECGSAVDHILVTLFNHGTDTLNNIPLSYQINDEEIVTEPATGISLAPGEQLTYTFVIPFNSLDLTDYTVTIWTDFADQNPDNNQTVFVSSALIDPLPLAEDFEAGVEPAGWTFNQTFGNIQFPNAHNNPTYNIGDNLYSFNPLFQVTTPWLGQVEEGQSLAFDYRYADYFAAIDSTILGPNDRLEVQIATFCSDIYTTIFTIDSSNHIPTTAFTTVNVDLADYVGESIKVRLQASWGEGDYWIDIDNINIFSCPESFDIAIDVLNASDEGMNDGSITIEPQGGTGPYSYLWNIVGETSNTLTDIPAGNYAVTVTDNFGCTDAIGVLVEIGVIAVDDPELIKEVTLMPNPTNGLTTLRVNFAEASDAQIHVMNLLGQEVFRLEDENVLSGEYLLDIAGQADGVYLVTISSGGEVKTLKLIKS
jgi:hypothetical protein